MYGEYNITHPMQDDDQIVDISVLVSVVIYIETYCFGGHLIAPQLMSLLNN